MTSAVVTFPLGLAWAGGCLDGAMSSLDAEYSTRERVALFQTLRSFPDPGHDGEDTMAGQAHRSEARRGRLNKNPAHSFCE